MSVEMSGKIEAVFEYLSLLSFITMVSAPKNLTCSSGLASRSRARPQASGESWSLDKMACVCLMISGGFGWYRDRMSYGQVSKLSRQSLPYDKTDPGRLC